MPRFNWYFVIGCFPCMHLLATVISLLKRIGCMLLPSLWLELMLRCCACIIHCTKHMHIHIFSAEIVRQVVFYVQCTFSNFMILVYTRLGEARYKMIEAMILILHRIPFSNNNTRDVFDDETQWHTGRFEQKTWQLNQFKNHSHLVMRWPYQSMCVPEELYMAWFYSFAATAAYIVDISCSHTEFDAASE